MAANDKRILNAVRLQLVLLNVANEAVQFKLTEIIKQRNKNSLNPIKDFLVSKYHVFESQAHPPHYVEGFMRTLSEKFRGDTGIFPDDLKEFDITACYPIARNFLDLSQRDMRPFNDLKDIRNKKYGHLNLLEIEGADYDVEMNRLKQIIDDFTQNARGYQNELRDKVKQIESIQELSSISENDMNNLKETILDLIINNRDMFSQITKVNIDIDTFIKIYKQTQRNQIDEIRNLSLELKTLSESIMRQKLSQDLNDQIAEAVSNHFYLEKNKLNFDETLNRFFDDIKRHTTTEINVLQNNMVTCFEAQKKILNEILNGMSSFGRQKMNNILMLSQGINDSIKFTERDYLNSILEKDFFFVKTSNIYLTKLHIQQILKNSNKIVLTFKFDVFEQNHTKIKDFMTKVNETSLIVECCQNENNKHLILGNFREFHVIIIEPKCGVNNQSQKGHEIQNQDYSFNDLTKETQNKLLDKRRVMFQGKIFFLKSLIQIESFLYLNTENLEKLIKDESDLEISKKDESNFDEVSEYYIPRQFKRYIQIKRQLLKNDKEKKFKIVHTEDEFENECLKQTQICHIHYLKDDINLVWQKSRGPISDLSEYLIKKDEYCLSIDESKILDQMEKVLIISADPGMGKSTILDKIISSRSERFFIKIILKNFTETLEKIKHNEKILEEQNINLKPLLIKNEDLEISIFENLAKKKKLVFMFDGVDEVNDYKEQVKTLIKALKNKYEGNKILLTTRNSLKEELEDYFQTISFDLNNFNKEDQVDFIVKYWESKNIDLDENNLREMAELIIENLKSNLTENISQLIGIPLQTKMIADIYLEKLSMKEIDLAPIWINNISDLYEKFVEAKFKLKHIEKKNINPRLMRVYLKKEREKFYKHHIELASIVLFNKKSNDSLDEDKMLETIGYGLIVNFRNQTPFFLHQSYAEYFLAKSSFVKIKQENDEVDEEIDQILIESEFFLVRKFLDNLLMHQDLREIKKAKTNTSKQQIQIKKCCRENLFNILNYLIIVKNTDIKSKNRFLLLATEKGNKQIVELLIEKGIDINQTDRNGQNALHLASEEGHKEIVQLLIEKGIEINQTNKDGQNALQFASFYGHKEIIEFLIEKGIDINSTNKDGQNALHWANLRGNKEIVKLLIEKGIDINQTNK